MIPKKKPLGRGLTKAKSEVSAASSDLRRMSRTRSDGLLSIRGRLSHRLALRVSRSLRTAIKHSGPSYGLESNQESVRQGSIVRAKVEAARKIARGVDKPLEPKPSLRPKRKRPKSRKAPKKLGIIDAVRKRVVFSHVKVLTRVNNVQVGTFREARRIGIWNIAIHPEDANRFEVPWLLLRRVDTRSFVQTGYRILYSPIKDKASDGIGHGLTVLNAELSTALNLGISYTHRLGIYGSISREDPTAVEDIFGWGVGEVPRRFIEKEVCAIEHISNKKPPQIGPERCPVCRKIRDSSILPVNNIVEIPPSLSYGCISCHSRQMAIMDFLRKHDKNHTLFQMSPTKCDQSPKSPDFALSYRFFYWKYWDMHGNKSFGSLPSLERKLEGQRWAPPVKRRDTVNLHEAELTIAVHARRGDFFSEKQRRMVPSKVFASVIKTAMQTVQEVGGVFAEMPAAVIVFSEGRKRKGMIGELHEQGTMDHDFVDTDGSVRDAMWFHRLLLPAERGSEGNRTHSGREKGAMFPSGVRVEFRVSTDVARAVHEMASADVFVGSASDLSQYAVGVVSRAGMQLMPKYMGSFGECCRVTFNDRSGAVRRRKRLGEFWRMYVMANEASAISALQDSLRQ